MSTIKGLFFDFDGVITYENSGSGPISAYIAKQLGMPEDVVYAAYIKHNQDLLYGRITHRDMWQEFCDDLGREVDYEVLQEAFYKTTIDKHVTDYIRAKKDKYLIGLITDNKVDRIEALLDTAELKGLFDVVIISAAVHSRKSESLIFTEALKAASLQPAECVFIDNNPKNLIVPAKMGFTTMFFDDKKREYDRCLIW